MWKPEVSVIVPVYNSNTYLEKCIKSILSQSFKDFELLLVDDGSTDNSGEICEYYANVDRRIRVFHKENGGVGDARNLGMDNACGKWVAFVDSDDWVGPDYLSRLVSCVGDGNVDMVVSGYDIAPARELFVCGRDFHILFDGDTVCYTVPWGKLYKADILRENHIRFDGKMRLGEDMVFLFSFMCLSDVVCVIGDVGYGYNRGAENSLSKRIFPLDDELYIYECAMVSINGLIVVKEIRNQLAVGRLNELKAYFIRRVLDSLYYNRASKKKRMEVIKYIDVPLYASLTISHTWKDKIYLSLLKWHYYICYDALRRLVAYVKQ